MTNNHHDHDDDDVRETIWGDHLTFNLLLHAARDSANASAAQALLNEMVDGGLVPTSLDYAITLQTLAFAGEWESALGILVSKFIHFDF